MSTQSLNGVRTATVGLEAGDQIASEVAVAEYDNYLQAQNAVDHLSDNGFPVREVSIVGRGLSSVERVTGRMTKGRAALAGSASGAWIGLLIGVLLGIFTPGLVWLGVVLTAVVLGALWGAAIGFVAHWATRGRRDFVSVEGIVAERYVVMVRRESASEAQRLLTSR
jgi:hypothetical protein